MIERDGFRELINPRIKPDSAPSEQQWQPQYQVMSLDIETSLTAEELFCIGWVAHSTDLVGTRSTLRADDW